MINLKWRRKKALFWKIIYLPRFRRFTSLNYSAGAILIRGRGGIILLWRRFNRCRNWTHKSWKMVLRKWRRKGRANMKGKAIYSRMSRLWLRTGKVIKIRAWRSSIFISIWSSSIVIRFFLIIENIMSLKGG